MSRNDVILKSSNFKKLPIIIRSLDKNSLVVYDNTISNEFLNFIAKKCSTVTKVSINELSNIQDTINSYNTIICFSLRSEEDLKKRVKEISHNIKNIYSVFADIFPKILGASNDSACINSITNCLSYNYTLLSSSNISYYAIINTPRSGSSFICDLLTNNGLGSPKEHLRPEVLCLLENYFAQESFDVRPFINSVVESGIQNKYFGTKLISHLLEKAIDITKKKQIEWIWEWIDSFKFIYLYRSDKVMQAISLYRARNTGMWHKKKQNNRVINTVEYDFDKILNCYETIIDQEKYVQSIINKILNHQDNFNSVMKIEYETLIRDKKKYMLEIMKFLASENKKCDINTKFNQIRSNKEVEIAERFSSDYKSVYSKIALRNFHPIMI